MSVRKNRLKETKKVLFPPKQDREEQPDKVNKFLERQFPWLKESHTSVVIVGLKEDIPILPIDRATNLLTNYQDSSKHEIEAPAAVRKKSMEAIRDEEKMLREKLKWKFSWLEEDSSDFSQGVCNLCQHKLPFKRKNLVSHENSKKHKNALLSVDQKELLTDSHDVEIVDKVKEPPYIPAHTTPSVECNSNQNQAVNHLYIKNVPLAPIMLEPTKFDNDNQHKYSYCKIGCNSQVPGFAPPIFARVTDKDFPAHITPSIECNSNQNQAVNHLYIRNEPLETVLSEPGNCDNGNQYKYSYCDIRSKSQVHEFAVPMTDMDFPEEDLTKLVANMCSRFSLDLKKLLRKNQQLMNYVTQNKEVSKGKKGILRLKKILVGHLSQYYLSESTIELWKHDTSAQTREQTALNAKLEVIQLQMERSIQELQDLKAQIREKERIDYHVL